MRLSWPSPGPTFCGTGRLAVGTVSPAVPAAALLLPLAPAAGGLLLVLLLLLQPAAASASTASPAAIAAPARRCALVLVMVTLPLSRPLAGVMLWNRECLLGPPGDADPVAPADARAALAAAVTRALAGAGA